jgi:hypothetical protein
VSENQGIDRFCNSLRFRFRGKFEDLMRSQEKLVELVTSNFRDFLSTKFVIFGY